MFGHNVDAHRQVRPCLLSELTCNGVQAEVKLLGLRMRTDVAETTDTPDICCSTGMMMSHIYNFLITGLAAASYLFGQST